MNPLNHRFFILSGHGETKYGQLRFGLH